MAFLTKPATTILATALLLAANAAARRMPLQRSRWTRNPEDS